MGIALFTTDSAPKKSPDIVWSLLFGVLGASILVCFLVFIHWLGCRRNQIGWESHYLQLIVHRKSRRILCGRFFLVSWARPFWSAFWCSSTGWVVGVIRSDGNRTIYN